MAESRSLRYLRQHRSHDAPALIRRWRQAVRGTGFQCRTLTKKDQYPLIQVSRGLGRANQKNPPQGGLYISTGIHGDEPAPPWALLEWFEEGGWKILDNLPVLLFPCLNPFGLVENLRVDSQGRDLNRLFDQPDLIPVREIRRAVAGRTFHLALCLHEDYDAGGAYLYDLNHLGDGESGRTLLHKSLTRHIPADERSHIEGHRANHGVIFRRHLDPASVPGLPEAVFLFAENHAQRTLTFETPSEFSLPERIQVQRRFLKAATQWCRAECRI